MKESSFCSIQVDDSTDIAGLPQLSVFIRYVNNVAVLEYLLFCKTLKLHTKGAPTWMLIIKHCCGTRKCGGHHGDVY